MDRAVSYSIAVALGAIGMTLIGYFVQAAPGDSYSFGYWLQHPVFWWGWPLFSAVVGFASWHMVWLVR